ncbi:hypothetical protein ILYODFUR_025633 [Ilyodon furcidens]|uniref:Coronin-7 n=1 Tax=Ilyodon furcidens TaxID=33524 RepID=A0ABV0U8S6_9TELE
MNRFKTSKFKNTTPKVAKKEGWINNVHAGSFSCQGNHIKASSKLVAFNTGQAGGGMVGLTSVNPSDSQWTVTQISCHSDLVTDMDFSPFDESLLATCSWDETVSHLHNDVSSESLEFPYKSGMFPYLHQKF